MMNIPCRYAIVFDYLPWTMDYGLWTMVYRLQTQKPTALLPGPLQKAADPGERFRV